jgi:purine nucleoside permease
MTRYMLNPDGLHKCGPCERDECPSAGPVCGECFAIDIGDAQLARAVNTALAVVDNGEVCDWRKLLADLARLGSTVLLTDDLAREVYRKLAPRAEWRTAAREHIGRPADLWPFKVLWCDTCQAPTYHAARRLDSKHGWGSCVMCDSQTQYRTHE